MTTSYLLAQDGSILNAEGGDRLIWDAVSGSVAITALGTVASVGRRVAQSAAAISGAGTLAAAGRRLARGAAAIAGAGTVTMAGLAVRTGRSVVTAISHVTAAGAFLWTAEGIDDPNWTPIDDASSTWTKLY